MPDLSIFDLSGKKALVTGGAGGIGKACAIGMAKAGADLAVIDLKDEMGEATAAEIRALDRRAIYIHCDVSDATQVQAMVKQVVEEFGRLDIAFNNAGTGLGGMKTVDDGAVEIYHQIIKIDLDSVFYCCREEARYMIPQRYGKIVNTASMAASIVTNIPFEVMPMGVGLAAYCAAKAGVRQLTKALALEWVPHNIYVNSISPGYITTPITEFILDSPDILAQENSLTPMHRQGQAEEMVGGVLYLVSDASSFTTGQDLIMDGGHTVW